MWKRIQTTLTLLVIVALAGAALYFHQLAHRASVVRRVVDPPAIVREIQQVQELVTVKYTIQKVIGLEEEKVPFGSESILMVVQAVVQGGIDLSQLTATNVQVAADNRVTINLPPAKILDVAVNDKETKVWQRTKTWWTPWVDFNPELEQQTRLVAREYVQTAALRMGILSNAQQNAETTIRSFLQAVGIPSVTFRPAAATP